MQTPTSELWHTIEIDGLPDSPYQISNMGRIKSKRGIIKGSRIMGYSTLNLRVNNKSVIFYVHRLVAKYFMQQPSPDQKFVIHLDRDKLNNDARNLLYVTQSEVKTHRVHAQAIKRIGKKNYKLRESQVKIIKRLLEEGDMKISHIAKMYKVSHTQLNRIRSGENWNGV